MCEVEAGYLYYIISDTALKTQTSQVSQGQLLLPFEKSVCLFTLPVCLCCAIMDRDDDHEPRRVSKRAKMTDDVSTSEDTPAKCDARPLEYFEFCFDKRLSSSHNIRGRNGKLHQGFSKLCIFEVSSNKLKLC